jgi:hypothetical protein
MKTRPLFCLALAALVATTAGHAAAAKAESATALALKRVADRYALTKTRISQLLDDRLHPEPLPNPLPNPFYRVAETPVPDAVPDKPVEAVVPAAADLSDGDTLARFAAGMKISGLIMLSDAPHLTINSALYKEGDVIPAGNKDQPVYIQVQQITPDELTLRLNDATLKIRLHR